MLGDTGTSRSASLAAEAVAAVGAAAEATREAARVSAAGFAGGIPASDDKPLVDPPEFDERVRDTDRQPYWIPGTFPTLFQNETGDPYNCPEKEVDLVTWGPHVMRSRG